ncbi:DNA-binding response regulator [Streptomyces sp. SID4919]|uniref:LuxR family transcriptional regulator n=1 Tax=Streptomyces uncialis TaxID=1048205 RepID=A0A1Q4VDW4_9ACTN|nr:MULTISPECIES: LuxR C-terminal-related transcriptional regulator [Streptomyces]MYY11917.1 DNA-binding response regulator [Streptomyces sp. SID4919]MCX4660709.1 LuxR C-terminal-related transcriptional regulator [Streptomyces uncialis]OKH96023.1 LuxR family transcriptional regulator [Streptomyces uncialis]WST68704.1 LuxR C-terminal-related transcriptional regulator [Streptomyces uncialis]WTE12666.1 LuxR C-terminal-related transcriptional regulator [Streptomyces uncialis]
MTVIQEATETEIRILRLLHEGLDDAAVARRLCVGHRTVQRRVHDLMKRWEVNGRVALGARAQELGVYEVVDTHQVPV